MHVPVCFPKFLAGKSIAHTLLWEKTLNMIAKAHGFSVKHLMHSPMCRMMRHYGGKEPSRCLKVIHESNPQ